MTNAKKIMNNNDENTEKISEDIEKYFLSLKKILKSQVKIRIKIYSMN